MPDVPIDIDQLRSDLAQAQERVRDLTELLELAERVYGAPRASSVSATTRVAPRTGPLTDKGTTDAVKVVFSKHPGQVVALDDIVAEMVSLGWDNGSSEQVDTVRVAVSRWMKKDSAIERVRLGYYRYTPPGWAAQQFHAAEQLRGPDPMFPVPNGMAALVRAEGG